MCPTCARTPGARSREPSRSADLASELVREVQLVDEPSVGPADEQPVLQIALELARAVAEHGAAEEGRRVRQPDERLDGPVLFHREGALALVREARPTQHLGVRIAVDRLLPAGGHAI